MMDGEFTPSISGPPSAVSPPLSEAHNHSGYCGLEVSRAPPHTIVGVDSALDVNGVRQGAKGYANPDITPGDRIVRVDGRAAEDASTNELQSMLKGSLHSVVELELAHPTTGAHYTVYLSRHTVDAPASAQALPEFILHSEKEPEPEKAYLGLQVTDRLPHAITAVDDVVDENFVRQGDPGYANPTIHVGDLILQVDGRSCTHVTVDDMHEMLRGSMNTPVDVTLARSHDHSQTYTVRVMRHRYHSVDALEEGPVGNSGRQSPYNGSIGHPGDADETLVGVGILMQQDPHDGALYVKSCVRGGSAQRSGQIAEGDRIMSVDGQTCAGTKVAQAREMIVGIQGTVVRIALRNAQGHDFDVSLTRGTADYLDQITPVTIPGSSRAEALLRSANQTLQRLQPPIDESTLIREEFRENERLRQRNTELEMEVANLQSVVARLQQQVDFERGSAKSVSHEVELIQKKYSDQIRDLHSMLNESEKARRDAEMKVSDNQKRETSVHEAIERAKEQADQREKFYGDICTKLEEERNHLEALLVQEKEARIRSGGIELGSSLSSS